jgi:antitoxin CcdA
MRVMPPGSLRASARAQRRSVNLTLPAPLVERAKAAGLNLSGIAEAAIAAEVERLARDRFAEEVRRGVDLHHRLVEEYGSFAEQARALREAEDEAG